MVEKGAKDLNVQNAVRVLSELQVDLVMTVHKRKTKHCVAFKDVDAVCAKFLLDARKQNPGAKCPALPRAIDEREPEAAGEASARMREFTASSLPTKSLAASGVTEGAVVERIDADQKVRCTNTIRF